MLLASLAVAVSLAADPVLLTAEPGSAFAVGAEAFGEFFPASSEKVPRRGETPQQSVLTGVRLAFGASPSSVLWLVLRRALTMMVIGTVVGLAGALALTRVMSGMLYEVQARDVATFAGATVGLAVLLLFASLIPAWRATRVDPIVALRMD